MTPGLAIRGRLVTLRTTVESDLFDYERWDDPALPAMRSDGPWYPDQSLDRVIASRRRWLAGDRKPPYRFLEVDAADRAHIGWVTAYLRRDDPHMTEFGIGIYEHDRWGGGIGTEACRLWVDYLFEAHGLARLGFSTWSGNPGMLRIGEKLGFSIEARIRNGCEVDGRFYDRIRMGILRREWERVRSGALP